MEKTDLENWPPRSRMSREERREMRAKADLRDVYHITTKEGRQYLSYMKDGRAVDEEIFPGHPRWIDKGSLWS